MVFKSENNRLTPSATLFWERNPRKIYQIPAIFDTGAEVNLISPKIVEAFEIPYKQKTTPYTMRLAEGSMPLYGDGQVNLETVPLKINLLGRMVEIIFDIVNVDNALIGYPWIKQQRLQLNYSNDSVEWPLKIDYNEKIDLNTNNEKIDLNTNFEINSKNGSNEKIDFDRPANHCAMNFTRRETSQGLEKAADIPYERGKVLFDNKNLRKKPKNGGIILDRPNLNGLAPQNNGPNNERVENSPSKLKSNFSNLVDNLKSFEISGEPSSQIPQEKIEYQPPYGTTKVRAIFNKKPSEIKALKGVPRKYIRLFPALFKETPPTGLPKHAPYDHKINLKPGTQPKKFPLRPLSLIKRRALKEFIQDYLRMGLIRESKSEAGYPVLFVPKKNGELRLCVDYRQLNEITEKDIYPLPLISEFRDHLAGAKWFTKIDLRRGYNLIRIAPGHEWKTAFRTQEGLYEFLVMHFGLTNAPATFQRFMDNLFKDLNYVIVYIDDILIFSKTYEENQQQTLEILSRLQKNNLLVAAEKSVWHVQKVEYLGHILEPGKIRIDPERIRAIQEWPTPRNMKDVQSFLGYTNFERIFIRMYGDIAAPLTTLTRKNVPFEWGPVQQEAFEMVKKRVAENPVLSEPCINLPWEMDTDASDYAIGAVLGQKHDGKFHTVAVMSEKFKGPEFNYPIHDKELMAIVKAFRKWSHWLEGTVEETQVYSDHQNLRYFLSIKILSQRQARWAEELSQYNFVIRYKPGIKNTRADVLSRRWDYAEGMLLRDY